jgi:hypothetical protein
VPDSAFSIGERCQKSGDEKSRFRGPRTNYDTPDLRPAHRVEIFYIWGITWPSRTSRRENAALSSQFSFLKCVGTCLFLRQVPRAEFYELSSNILVENILDLR